MIVRDLSDVPCIVMGDMNDVSGSPCMKVFANAGLRDTWWDGGFGYGATIHEPVLYRIDHVMDGIIFVDARQYEKELRQLISKYQNS